MLTRSLIYRLRAERGFTLIETLVSMVTGLIITFAAFALLQVASNQSSRATDFVQASQLGRNAMTHIVDELNTACPTAEFKPVQEKSTEEKLIFVNGISKEAELAPAEFQKHEIVWTKEGSLATGTLTEKKYSATEKKTTESGPEFVWSTAKETRLGEHIAKPTTGTIFQYYEYASEATDTSETGLSALKPITMPKETEELGKTPASKVSSVLVSFRQLPTDRNEKLNRSVDLSSQVTFAFTASIAEPTITDGPCQ